VADKRTLAALCLAEFLRQRRAAARENDGIDARRGEVGRADENAIDTDDAGLADISTRLQHANTSTTKRHCIKPTTEPTRRVARKRVAHRQGKATA
jgi:hypothetical protein